MFEEGGGGGKSGGDRVDGRKGVWSGRVEGGVVFEGEERAEAMGEGGLFRAEGLAKGWDGVSGCGLLWRVEKGLCFCRRGCDA